VEPSASVTGGALVSRDARVAGSAAISGAVVVTDHAVVDGSAQITGSVRLDGHAHVGGSSQIDGDDIHIGDDASVTGEVQLRGSQISVTDRTKLDGRLRIGTGAQILHSTHVYAWDGGHDGTWTVYRNHQGTANALRDGSWEPVIDVEHSTDAPHELKREVKNRGW